MTLTPTTCPLDCPDACGVLVETDAAGDFVRVRGNRAHSYTRGALCSKTSIYGELVTSPDRLTTPLVRENGELVEASWGAALDRIVERVRGLPGDSILSLSYAGTMGVVQRRFPMRTMHALGAAVTDGALCDSTGDAGYRAVLGDTIGPDIEEAAEADFLLLWGCDIRRTHQHLQPAAQNLAKRGVPVIAIDIYRTDSIQALERWGGTGILVKPGTDAALGLGLARAVYDRGFADREFLESECTGAEPFEAHVRSAYDVESVCEITGVTRDEFELLFDCLTKSRRPFLKAGIGWTRRRNGGASIRAMCSLAAVRGVADRVHYESADHFQLDQDAIERPDLRPDGRPPQKIHHVQLGRELESGRFKAVFVWGHNPAVVVPDVGRVRAGLAREDVFLVVHEHFLTETAELADVVLPATMFVEHADVYRSYGHRVAHFARQGARPPAGPRSNVDAFGAIGRALGLPEETWAKDDVELCETLLEASAERIGPEALASLRAGKPTKLPPLGNGWTTPSGKIELLSSAAAVVGEPALATYVPDDASGETGAYWLVSAPSVHTHNSTFSYSSRHVKRAGAPLFHFHPEDARELGLEEGELVTLENSFGSISLATAISERMPRGMIRVDGVPRAVDTPEGVGINVLVSPAVSDLGDGNTLYSTRVDARPFRA